MTQLRDDFETVYKIFHKAEYGFGGDTSIWLAVTEETDSEIRGKKFGPMNERPGKEVVVRKDNVAGWEVDQTRYRSLPEEEPTPTEDELKRAYKDGRIDEEELEDGLMEVLE